MFNISLFLEELLYALEVFETRFKWYIKTILWLFANSFWETVDVNYIILNKINLVFLTKFLICKPISRISRNLHHWPQWFFHISKNHATIKKIIITMFIKLDTPKKYFLLAYVQHKAFLLCKNVICKATWHNWETSLIISFVFNV